jgi:spore coat polysaccharide biosynthesis protein SpsF (cytidylyltransferase family)
MQNPTRYSIVNLEAPVPLRRPDISLEVDTAVDFDVLRDIIEALYPLHPAFTTEDILNFLDAHPHLATRNQGVERRWKAFLA